MPEEGESLATHPDAMHEALMQAVQDAVIVLDPAYNIIYCNRHVEDILGWSPAELIGQTCFETITGAMARTNAAKVLALLRTEPQWAGGFQAKHRDGTLFPAQFTAIAARDRDGKPIRYVLIIRQPNERPELESQLSSASARWESLMRHIPARILMVDAEAKVLYSNSTQPDRLSRNPESGIAVFEVLPPEAADDVRRALAAAFEQRETTSFETLSYSDSGEAQASSYVVAPVIEGDEMTAAILIGIDTSQRRRAGQALAERETRLRSVFRAAPVGIGLLKERILLDVNSRLCEMTGYTRAELLGRTPRSLYDSDEEYSAVGHAVSNQIREHGTASLETRWRRKDGSFIDILLNSAALNPDQPAEGLIQTALDISARRRAEAALLESQRLYRTLLSNLPGMACRFRIARERLVEFVSDGCLALTGYPPHVLMANRVTYDDLVHAEDREALWPQISSALQRQAPYTLTYRIRSAQGDQRWVWEQGRGVYGAAGQAIAIESFISDVTESREAQEAIRANEERLRQTIQTMPVMLTAVDPSRTYVVWNQECERVTGYSADEMLHNPEALTLLYPDPGYRAWVLAETASRQYDFRELELEVTCKDGSHRTISWSNQSLRHPIPGWQSWGVGIDITEDKQTERLLREQATLMRYVSDAIIVLDFGFVIRGWNEAAERLFGWPAEETIGRSMEAVSPMWFGDVGEVDVDAEAPRQGIAQATGALLAQGVWRGEAALRHRQGYAVHLLATASLMFDEKQSPSGVLVLLHDITERKRAEIALRESEDRYRSLAEALVDGVFVHQDGCFVFANRAGAQLLGADSPEDLLGRSIFDFAQPEDYARIEVGFAEAMAGRAVNRGTIELRKPDGRAVCLEGTLTNLVWDGRPAIQIAAHEVKSSAS